MKKDYFTGPVTLREISRITKPTEHDIYNVMFKKSARTKLHFHNGNQVLMAVKGKGSLEIFKKFGSKKTEFKIKRIERISLNEEILYTFQQKHSTLMDQLIKIKNFHILQSTYCLKRIQYTKQRGTNQILKIKLQKSFKKIANTRNSRVEQYCCFVLGCLIYYYSISNKLHIVLNYYK